MNTVVTEQEMRNWAERLISTVVGYSEQARQLGEVQYQLDDLRRQFNDLQQQNVGLRDTNQHLQEELARTREELNNTRSEANGHFNRAEEAEHRYGVARAEADANRQELESLRNFLVARDAKVSELTDSLHRTEEALRENEGQLSVANRQIEELRNQFDEASHKIANLEMQLQEAVNTRNSAFSERDKYKEAFDAIHAQLTKLQEAFAPKQQEYIQPFSIVG